MLRRMRAERDFSQEALASTADVSTRHLGFIELGKSEPSREMVLHLAEALGVSQDERKALLAAAGFSASDQGPEDFLWHRRIVEDSPVGMVVIDHSRRVVLANHAQARLMGAPNPAAIIGKDLRTDQIWSVPAAQRVIEDCLDRGLVASFSTWGTTKHGRRFNIHVDVVPIMDDAQRIVGAHAVVSPLPLEERDTNVFGFELAPKDVGVGGRAHREH